jgi:23S rRNA (guanosine2251-2'-O)-methyltransferase
MAGNSQRQNRRKAGTKKGAVVGSGGQRRKALQGKGPTPKASERTGHPALRKAKAAARKAEAGPQVRTAPGRRGPAAKEAPELLVGRNPVVEALRAGIPATALYVAQGLDSDDRVTEALQEAGGRGLAIMEVSRHELDRMTGGVLHQGLGLQVPPYAYSELDDVLETALQSRTTPLLVALDGVTDPRNVGAVIRSVAAFGGHGVFMTERRAAGITATAWRTSAGAAARVPVSQVVNLTRSIKACQQAGFTAIGLDADGETDLYQLEAAVGPLLVVVGSEGRGMSRLVGETCDLRVSIPMSSDVESLNASVAAAVTLAEVARRRIYG